MYNVLILMLLLTAIVMTGICPGIRLNSNAPDSSAAAAAAGPPRTAGTDAVICANSMQRWLKEPTLGAGTPCTVTVLSSSTTTDYRHNLVWVSLRFHC